MFVIAARLLLVVYDSAAGRVLLARACPDGKNFENGKKARASYALSLLFVRRAAQKVFHAAGEGSRFCKFVNISLGA
ncbi:hypothetical protein DW086_05465 [Harryflintia acetispora]|nr:hypothetical protein DW086_05465 [Harryflintia acetispora]